MGAFTLVELMAVVAITGILATIAIPVFQGYVMKARTTEATEFIGVIKLRQEAYKSEFGRYAQIKGNTSTTISDFAPGNATVMASSISRSFPAGPGCDTTCATDWGQLGANPGGPVRFGYGMAAGLPATAPTGNPYNYTADHWWLVRAVSDLNGNGVECTFEGYSQSKNIWYDPPKGWE